MEGLFGSGKLRIYCTSLSVCLSLDSVKIGINEKVIKLVILN